MKTLCPTCFKSYINTDSDRCTCGHKTIGVCDALTTAVKLFIDLGFKVSYANCGTYKDRDGSGKQTQLYIDFSLNYSQTIFAELPPDWLVSNAHLVYNSQLSNPYTMLTCVLNHPPSECDHDSIQFSKRVTISNLESWLEGKDPEAFKAILILAGYL